MRNVIGYWIGVALNQYIALGCCSAVSYSLRPHEQASLYFTISQSFLKFMPLESVMPPSRLIFYHPLLLLPSIFPSIRIFSCELALLIKWPKYWTFSFSISLSDEYSGLISLGLTALISLLSKGLSRVFSNTTVKKHQFFGAQPSLWSNSHIHI